MSNWRPVMPESSPTLQAAQHTAAQVGNTVEHVKTAYAPVNQMLSSLIDRLPYLALALGAFVFFWLLSKLFRFIVAKVLNEKRVQNQRNLVMVLNRIGTTLIIFVGFLVAMVIAVPGFTPGQLISTLGIGSVAIGFAFKDVFQNLLSGILILLNQPFRIGDQIVSGSFEGTVEDIQIRATYLKTYDGRRIVIPNAQLFTSTVTVNTAYSRRRLQADVGIGCSDDIDDARQVILDCLQQCQTVVKNAEPTVVLTELGDYSNNLRIRWWIEGAAQVEVIASTDEVLTQVKRALTNAGIDLPFPTHQILFHDQTEETDGDRTEQREGWPANPDGSPRSRAKVQRDERLGRDLPYDLPVRHRVPLKPHALARDPSEATSIQPDDSLPNQRQAIEK